MKYELALRRLNLLKGHFKESEDAKAEKASATLNIAHAQEKLWDLLPGLYIRSLETLPEIQNRQDFSSPSKFLQEADQGSFGNVAEFVNNLIEAGYTSPSKIAENIEEFLNGVSSPCLMDLETSAKITFHYALYCNTLKNLGTEIHQDLLMDAINLKNIGCFCLTELGHGSNIKGIETTATFDLKTQEFVLNSPTETSRKFWIGNLSKSATHAVVFAQLIHKERRKEFNRGLHGFVVQIREKPGLPPFQGIEVGSCELEEGLNLTESGWAKFTDFRIPKNALLNKFSDVSEKGSWKREFIFDNTRIAASLSAIASGRILNVRSSSELGLAALNTAIRYGCVRRQFGSFQDECKIFNLPFHQHCLIPLFAENLIFYVGSNKLSQMWSENLKELFNKENPMSALIHDLSCTMKSFSIPKVQEIILECKRSCGGFGYSSYSNFSDLSNYNDFLATWDGDNYTLRINGQKTIIDMMEKVLEGKQPGDTFNHFNLMQMTKPTFEGSIGSREDLTDLFKKRSSHLSTTAIFKLLSSESSLTVFLEEQKFEFGQMSESYLDVFLIETFTTFIDTLEDEKTKIVFEKLLLLHLTTKITENYDAGCNLREIIGEERSKDLEDQIKDLCKDLRGEMFELTKLLPYPDFKYGVLGGDLNVFEKIIQRIDLKKSAS